MENQWHNPLWYVSPYNFDKEVTKRYADMPSSIVISDCTLREGEQQPGVVLNTEQKVAFAAALDDLGVHEIEGGMPIVSKQERETVKAIANSGLKAPVTCLVRARKDDIDVAKECGVSRVNLSLPASRSQIEQKLKMTYDQVIDTVVEMSNYAAGLGLRVTISPYDTTRAEWDFLQRYVEVAETKGQTDRVRLVDTRGCASAESITYLVKKFKSITDLPIEIHCHDDFGIATANTLAALAAGAQIASTTFNGMGERAGNASTEEIILALRLLYGIDTGIKTDKLFYTSQLLQKMTKVNVQPHKAIGGANAFSFESGISVAGLLSGDLVAQAYLPELVGAKTRILLGKGSGKDSVRFKLNEIGKQVSDDDLQALVNQVKELSEAKGRAITDGEFLELTKTL